MEEESKENSRGSLGEEDSAGEQRNSSDKDQQQESNDRVKPNTGKEGPRMYIISSEWLFKWKCFVLNKISRSADKKLSSQVRKSENTQVGILPPGPITNGNLFETLTVDSPRN